MKKITLILYFFLTYIFNILILITSIEFKIFSKRFHMKNTNFLSKNANHRVLKLSYKFINVLGNIFIHSTEYKYLN